ncbi:6-N-hydroxylaminopurine resistance protein [Arcobacter porcinus]|uniref:6-N-hydroxylaminopurine resistance protein n=2 Tax=Arcobacter porcinus TaxID=1935204 RepID=A0ABX2YF71_9BACT|nr:6-N-hydroxylaminopurine resistance protein [Arcobacter porcinus]OCL82509.1 6-N-hydroxylaminopurine resistance protein [Arcobacter porcinus]OCL87354.1 6-N-hydroxylaminopurine resistance protein [Arcobacter porcinus]OCL93275.1 6-N-hydroxylaminopurine resistance protein [Arcobacter porcinus]
MDCLKEYNNLYFQNIKYLGARMNTKISTVLYLKVGDVSVTKLENQKREELVSGIKKYPVSKSYLTKTGFVDDFQADLAHHGGVNKALFLLTKKTYENINKHFKDSFDMTNMAYFGENLILDEICEKDICIGDILKIGEAKVQITQPRQPCWKLSANTQKKEMTNLIFQNGYTGFYAKVLIEGNICQNDDVILESRVNHNLTIEKLNKIIVDPKIDLNLTEEAINCEDLGYQFKNSLKKRFELGDLDNQFSFYHT